MPRIELNSLIGTMTPEQIIMTSWFYSQFDYSVAGSGLNRHIANVEPLYYCGLIAGTEFLVYAATKLYLCFYCNFTYSTNIIAVGGLIGFLDENNVGHNYAHNNAILYDNGAAAYRYSPNMASVNNIYFSRFGATTYTGMIFIGYRITLD